MQNLRISVVHLLSVSRGVALVNGLAKNVGKLPSGIIDIYKVMPTDGRTFRIALSHDS